MTLTVTITLDCLDSQRGSSEMDKIVDEALTS
jgi:hypothetical protein